MPESESSSDTTSLEAPSSPAEGPSDTGTVPTGPSVSDLHQVVAQGIVAFAAGEHHWEFTTSTVTPAVSTIDTGNPTFVVSDVPDGVLVGPSGQPPSWRLGGGEATFHRDGGTLDAVAVSPTGGSVILIKPAPGAGPDSFTPGEGPRDVDLVRDVLGTNEALLLRSTIAAFVLVTAGAVDAAGPPIVVGSPVALSGDVTLINIGTEPAAVLIAVIGPAPGDPAPTAADVDDDAIGDEPTAVRATAHHRDADRDHAEADHHHHARIDHVDVKHDDVDIDHDDDHTAGDRHRQRRTVR